MASTILSPERQTMRQQITELWATGISLTAIAGRLCVTKSTVAGIARRMKLPLRGNPKQQRTQVTAPLCQGCQRPCERRPTETVRAFLKRRYCSRACAVKVAHGAARDSHAHGRFNTVHTLPKPERALPPPTPGPLSARNTCSWIESHDYLDVIGRGGDPFCGKPALVGTSWCPSHHARVYMPPSKKDVAA